ncbi:hypothetical protein F511_37414 [Dorcoceras hygrometricum]|uniref:Uncharacterized protein n=1 Tax=Dorcoceras hygrometricum TaxID=472368 RepID=A0A2Z7CFJ1_9LAMI|nr:hypothetical protein F511_37414 [Dorcoceras hygrometricum]
MSYVSPYSFFRKVPREDLIYTSCTDPIQQPAAARTPRLHQPSAVTHLFYAYVRKATNTEFNIFVLGRDLILLATDPAKHCSHRLNAYQQLFYSRLRQLLNTASSNRYDDVTVAHLASSTATSTTVLHVDSNFNNPSMHLRLIRTNEWTVLHQVIGNHINKLEGARSASREAPPILKSGRVMGNGEQEYK